MNCEVGVVVMGCGVAVGDGTVVAGDAARVAVATIVTGIFVGVCVAVVAASAGDAAQPVSRTAINRKIFLFTLTPFTNYELQSSPILRPGVFEFVDERAAEANIRLVIDALPLAQVVEVALETTPKRADE